MSAKAIIIPSVVGLAIFGYIYLRILSRRFFLRSTLKAARSLGLAEETSLLGGPRIFSGNLEGMPVRMEKHDAYVRLEITITTNMPDGMLITGESGYPRYGKAPHGREFITRDETFDSFVSIKTADNTEALAFLDADTRKNILTQLHRVTRLKITARALTVIYDTMRTPHQRALVKNIRHALDTAKSLQRDIPLKERLITIMGKDPLPAIRQAAISAAAIHFPADPEAITAIEASLMDSNLPVMLEAARTLGQKGTSFLLDYLVHGKGVQNREIIEIIEAVMGGTRVAGTACALEKIFMKRRNPAVRKSVLAAFTELGDTAAGPFLAGQLERFDSDIRAGIIEALGTCGTVMAVEKLHAALKDTVNPFARSDIEKSIASIQSRLGADRGWLSVSESAPLEGALSPGGIEKGSLSLDTRKK